ncbi:MAG: M20/M25/M40 family metallo-hydrolase [Flavobacteriales bacterium]
MNFALLRELCGIHAPSGNEVALKEFLLNYIKKNKKNWCVKPIIHQGGELQDALILEFGAPRTAVFAHMDSIGFTVRYGKQLIKIGGPKTEEGYQLVGNDSRGLVDAELVVFEDENGNKQLEYLADRKLDRGTELVFKPNWRENKNYIQCCYMDNRLGIFNALKLAENLKDGLICFTCYEEHGGGSAQNLGRFIFEKFGVQQALISDITWVTEGVRAGKGVAISMRDSGIPRRSYLNKIISLAEKSKIKFQLEVEAAGGSHGNALQRSSFPIDWCFIGAPEDFVHSPNEKVHKEDIYAMVEIYAYLMKKL